MTQPQKPQDANDLISEDLALLAYLLEKKGIEADRLQITPEEGSQVLALTSILPYRCRSDWMEDDWAEGER